VRISSIELNEINDELIEIMKINKEKICRYIHVPLQSGNDDILRKMNRKYLTIDFEKKINKIMQILPDLALTTDIIAGFPGETRKHHKETCSFVQKIPFARFHIFRYSDRQGTNAFLFKNKIHPNEIKNRAKDLFEIDSYKRKDFLKKNMNTRRNAVKIGKDKVLTDNYITIKKSVKDLNVKNDIFEVEITDSAKI